MGRRPVTDSKNLLSRGLSNSASHPRHAREFSVRARARVLGAGYQRLRDAAMHGYDTVLDTYRATTPAEFFAVATECFFEEPAALRRRHPELYAQLTACYQQDPERMMAGDDNMAKDRASAPGHQRQSDQLASSTAAGAAQMRLFESGRSIGRYPGPERLETPSDVAGRGGSRAGRATLPGLVIHQPATVRWTPGPEVVESA